MNSTPLTLVDWELSPRWGVRAGARSHEPEADTRPRLRCVEFQLRGVRVALPLDGVDRLIPRVGALVPLASGQAVSGIALVGGEPLLAVDLEDAATEGAPSSLPLEDRPALVLPYEGGRIALVISGPADLIEAPFEERKLGARGPLEVRGFVAESVALLREESVTGWLAQRLGGAS